MVLLVLLAANGAAAGQWRWSDVDRIVVLPDIHGAYPAAIRLLQATGVIDETLAWSGGDTHLVSLGDFLDRGAESRNVMDLLIRLQQEAQADGGHVHVVAGNHELMNLIGDLRYVSREEFAAFADLEPGGARDEALERFRTRRGSEFATEVELFDAFSQEFPPGFFGHRAAFRPDGRYGSWLQSLPAVVTVNDIAFAHGGLPPMVASRSLGSLNQYYRTTVAEYLRKWRELVGMGILPSDSSEDAGELARSASLNAVPSNCIEERQQTCERETDNAASGLTTIGPETMSLLEEFVELSDSPILGTDGPLWYRGAVYCRDILERPILDAALQQLRASRVVVGHTITADKKSHAIHDGQLIMLDTGMLASYYAGRPAALIVENDTYVVQYLDPDERLAPLKGERYEAYDLTGPELEIALRQASVSNISRRKNGPWPVELSFRDHTLRADFYPRNRSGSDARELAAYTLDALIGIDLVPVTVERELEGKPGALQLRYPDAISEADRQDKGLQFGGWCSIPDQLQLMYAWDLLLANSGRNYENLMFRQNSWYLHLNDHRRAFGGAKRLPKAATAGAISLAPGVRAAIAALSEEDLQASVGAWLSRKQIRALLSRRDEMLRLF